MDPLRADALWGPSWSLIRSAQSLNRSNIARLLSDHQVAAQDIPNVRPVNQRRFAMRLVSFVLFSVIALASSAPSAFAAENAFGRASLSSATCPMHERYPDCHLDSDVQWTVYSSRRRLSR